MKNLYRIEQAIEFIEQNLDKPITLTEIASSTSFSMFYLTKLFNQILGETIMEYVRKRRLTLASRELIKTDIPIIEVALDCGYDSQEAFTRAFKKIFKMTPARFRKRGVPIITLERQRLNLANIISRRRFKMKEPKIIKHESFQVAGMLYHGKNENGEISAMWQEYLKVCKDIPGVVDTCICYGVCYDFVIDKDDKECCKFDYVAGHEVTKVDNLPEGMVSKIVPAGKWLVFEHKGKLDTLGNTYKYIHTQYIPDSKFEPAGMDIEYYGDRFIPDSDDSIFEIWIKIKE